MREIARALRVAARRARSLYSGAGVAYHDPIRDPNWLTPGERLSGTKVEPFADSAWVYRCVRVLADNAQGVPFRLYTGPEADAREVETGPWADLFRRPNPSLSMAEVVWTTVALKNLDGECFWLLQGRGDRLMPGEIPTEIWPAMGSLFREEISPTTGLVEAWTMRTASGERVLEPHEVCFHRYLHPRNPTRGLSPLEAGLESVETEIAATRWNRRLLENNSIPGGVVSGSTTLASNETALRRERAKWRSQFEGPDNVNRVAFLPEGATFQEIGHGPKEMDWIEGLQWSRQKVATLYGLTLFMLGIVSEVHRETSREARRLFWIETEKPLLEGVAGTMESQLFFGRGAGRRAARIGGSERAVFGAFDYSEIPELQTEMRERLLDAAEGRKLGIPLNELIESHDLPYEPQEEGDVGILPIGVAPVPVVMADLDLDEEPAPSPPSPPDEGPDAEAVAPENDDEEGEEDEERAVPSIWAGMPGVDVDLALGYEVRRARGGFLVWTSKVRAKRREKLWRSWVKEVQRPGERKVRRIVGGYMKGRAREVLAAIRRFDRTIDPNEIDAWLEEQESRWKEILSGSARAATGQTAERALGWSGQFVGGEISTGMASPAVLRFLATEEARYATISGNQTLRVRREIAKGLSLGEGVADLQKRIVHRFEVDTARALTIARTETGVSANTPVYEASGEEDGITGGEWLSAGDEEVRVEPNHAIDGERRAHGEAFSNGLLHPNDPAGSAENVINCRCVWLPIADEI